MIVLSYLEFCDPQGTYKRKDMLKYFQEKTTFEFYSQQFSPDLIKNLFADWEINYIDGYWFNKNLIDKEIEFIENGYEERMLIGPCTDVPMPKTLNDFITDCKRSGIILYWKENL